MDNGPTLAPSVVAVVVVHDPGPWFDETLTALAAQDYPNLRHLFLLVGRLDADELEARTQRILGVIPQAFVRATGDERGFGASANEVLRLVEGDNGFFLVCHDDIAPAPDAVRLLVTELYRSNAGMVGPKLVEWAEPRRLQHVGLGLDRFGEVDPIVEPGELDQEQHDAVRDVFVLPSACLLVRADLFRLLGGYDPAIDFHGDDVDLCWRAHLQGARVVVAPDARVRHRERLEERRPDLNHAQLRARHRMRVVATLTGGSRLAARSVQMVLLTLAELVVGLFTGRVGEALSSLRALGGLVIRTPALIARRRVVAPQRSVPEREVLGLQVSGSARLTSYLRARETTTYIGDGTTVRRWRETSFGPLLTWFAIILAIVIGSRTLIDRGVPPVGEFLPFPESARDLLATYRSAWDAGGLGATSPAPTGIASLALLSALALFRMDLAMTMAVVGAVLVGALGAWRLGAVFPSNRGRIATLVVYVATPLVPGLLGTGDWSGLAWYAALPWLVHLLRRSAGIDTADPALADIDVVDGIAALPLRQRVRFGAVLAVVLALTAAFVPVAVALWTLCGLLLAAATLLVGGSLRSAGMFAATTVGSAATAVVLNLPWATTWTWERLVGPQPDGAPGLGLVRLATLSLDGREFTILALGLYLPLVAAVGITRAWRLTWAVRGAVLVAAFGALAVLADRGELPIAVPGPELLLVPVALGLALASGSIAGGFGEDVLGRGFGWRQPLAVVASAAIVVAVVPATVSIGNGAWGMPRTPLPVLLGAQLPEDPATGDYRVLFVGDARVLPVAAAEYRDGISYAVVDDGSLDFTRRWAAPETAADEHVVRALDHIAAGSTLRAGQLLAPLGIRYVVVPRIDGAISTAADPLPLPAGLVAALTDQLDIGETYGPPNLEIFENRAWIPTRSELAGPTAEASQLAGDGALVAADLDAARPVFVGADHLEAATDALDGGVVHLAVPFDERWSLEVGGTELDPRVGFGVTTAFDVAGAGPAELRYTEPAARTIWVVVQTLLWLVVLLAATRARSPFPRRRGEALHDETLIDLDETADEPLDAWGDQVLDPLMARPDRGSAP